MKNGLNDKNEPLFTEEQLKAMSPKKLAALNRIMGQHAKKMEDKVSSLEIKLQLMQDKIAELEFMNAMLNEKLTLAERKRFGISSEKNADGYEQLSLFNEAEDQACLEEPEYIDIHPTAHKRKKKQGQKETVLSSFPVVRVEYKLKGDDLLCEQCGAKKKVVATETRRSLRFVPARFETLEEITYVYSCSECEEMERAKQPPALLKGSLATASLVAAIMNGKYVNGLPLYRQEKEFRRYELELSTKTMANWMILCSDKYLRPVYERMRTELVNSKYIQCDETRVQVLDEPEQKASTTNWMWAYMTGSYSGHHRMILFDYERTRGGYHPKEFLFDYEGYLSCDGYQVYHGLPETIKVSGCFAHARRRYDEALTVLKKQFTKEQLKETVAWQALARIGMLYKIEDLIRDLSPQERYEERQKQSKPLLDAYFEWLKPMKEEVDRQSLIGKAVLYSLNQEEYLRKYLENGHLPIDNNECERSLKNFAVGRRNWLFSKSIAGAQSSAIIYSITESALLNGLRPYEYLSHIMETIRLHDDGDGESYLDNLLPWSSNLPDSCRSKIR